MLKSWNTKTRKKAAVDLLLLPVVRAMILQTLIGAALLVSVGRKVLRA